MLTHSLCYSHLLSFVHSITHSLGFSVAVIHRDDCYCRDEKEEVINAVRNEVKAQGEEDTNQNCWNFFIRRVRQNLKVVLCFSPVGETLRARARMFPAVVNCTSIDWFHDWPFDALMSVSAQVSDEQHNACYARHTL